MIGMRRPSERLANKIICSVETCLLNESRKVVWAKLEVLHMFDSTFDVLQAHQDVNEKFFLLRITHYKLLSGIHPILVLNKTNK